MPRGALRLLRQVARFGYLTAGQAAVLIGARPTRASRALRDRGWLVAWTFVAAAGLGHPLVYGLTPSGRRAAGLLPEAPQVPARVRPDRADALLSAADLAIELDHGGAAAWRTWAEQRAVTGGLSGGSQPPAGLLGTPGGGLLAVWIVLHRQRTGPLERGIDELRAGLGLGRVQVRALPALCASLERALGLGADVVPWTPPHLGDRGPLPPGWARGMPRPQGSGRAAGPGPRGVAVLRFLHRFGYATAAQVARASDLSRADKAVRALACLERLGLVQRCRPLGRIRRGSGGGALPDVWSATAAGLAAAGGRSRAVPAVPRRLRHTLALVEVALELERETGGRWEAERELAPEVRLGFGAGPGAVPDGRLTLGGGRRVLIQLQLTRGDADGQLRNAWAQRQLGLGDEVWFLCVPAVAGAYRARLQPGERSFIRIRDWSPPPGSRVLAEGSPGWYPPGGATPRGQDRGSGPPGRMP